MMLSLPLTASLFLHQHSWRCSACSIYVTTPHPSVTLHNTTHTHTHTPQPILSWLVFQRGSRIWQSLSLAWGSGLIKTHHTHLEYYYPPLLSVPVRLAVIWCGWKGLTGAVWGYTSTESQHDSPAEGESCTCSEPHLPKDLGGWPAVHQIQLL